MRGSIERGGHEGLEVTDYMLYNSNQEIWISGSLILTLFALVFQDQRRKFIKLKPSLIKLVKCKVYYFVLNSEEFRPHGFVKVFTSYLFLNTNIVKKDFLICFMNKVYIVLEAFK